MLRRTKNNQPSPPTIAQLICVFGLVLNRTMATERRDPLSAAAAYIEHDDMCGDIRAQNGVDIQQMTGIWYGNELLHHDAAATVANKTHDCIIVEISQETTTVRPLLVPYNYRQSIVTTPPPTPPLLPAYPRPTHSVYKKQLDQQYFRNDNDHRAQQPHNTAGAAIDHYDYNHHLDDINGTPHPHNGDHDDIDRHSHDYLRLIWDDSRTGPVAYTLRYNHTARGTWRTEDPATVHANGAGFYKSPSTPLQRGADTPPPQTTFLVMKAVGNHVVLTMCETLPQRRIVSITLSRATGPLSGEDLESVRKLLRRRHLSIYSREPLCVPANVASSRTTVQITLTTTAMLIGVATLMRR